MATSTGVRFVRDLFSSMHVMTIAPFSYLFKFGTKDLPRTTGQAAEFVLGKVLTTNAAISAVRAFPSVGTYLEALVAEVLFTLGQFWYYKFLINPQQFQLSNNKIQTVEETSDLTIINTYRNAAPTMTISGVSGCLLPRQLMSTLGIEGSTIEENNWGKYPKLSPAYIKFRQLEKFYNEINSDILILYDMDLYIGKFVNFSYSQNANNPYLINYNMTFRIYPGLTLHTLSVYDYKDFFNNMLTRYGNSFSKNFEGKSVTNKK